MLLRDGGTAPERDQRGEPADLDSDDAERTVLCAACGATITTADRATRRSGEHRHAFANPSGRSFLIACYERAAGCRPVGERESFFSWFAGYRWQIAICARCHTHVGWSFHADGDTFFGLIVDRLRFG